MQGTLEHYREALAVVGWFIPPYITMGYLDLVCSIARDQGSLFSEDDLERVLAVAYSAGNTAAMVTERYPITPFVQDYKIIISEAVQAHFSGLDHVAVCGLMPVIEGVARKLANDRKVENDHIRPTFKNLADDCKRDLIETKRGDVGELVSMLDSFRDFADTKLYIGSRAYTHPDKMNRNGILHGSYTENYGRPINFYKAIAAINFLCLVSALKANVPWRAPSPTEKSQQLSNFYLSCQQIAKLNPLT
ncbi:hypothetical protein [Stutzerimonas kunmingensis]|uniref:hypothetical protein n=1 Tax=Stutzerimonas kunmingensis TaxID=1211807 RepID=UPI0028A9D235|nr:hypothetical protein [Stutzerimonas kunmingensis]